LDEAGGTVVNEACQEIESLKIALASAEEALAAKATLEQELLASKTAASDALTTTKDLKRAKIAAEVALAKERARADQATSELQEAIRHETAKEEKTRFRSQVIMFIPTPITWAERRTHVIKQFQRENWDRSQVVLIFVFGTRAGPQLEEEVNISSAVQEQLPGIDYFYSTCRDIGDEFDNPNGTSSTTCKVYEACKYIARNYEAEYVWRGADDTYVNMKLFFQIKATLPSTRLYMGQLRKPTLADTDLLLERQPRLQELFGLHQFGHYMLGMAFVFSWDVAEFVGTLSIPPHQTWCEDVMIGMWLSPFQITFANMEENPELFFHASLINSWDHSRKCLAAHYMHPHEWESIDENGMLPSRF
jgi:hypothetical protein